MLCFVREISDLGVKENNGVVGVYCTPRVGAAVVAVGRQIARQCLHRDGTEYLSGLLKACHCSNKTHCAR